MRINMVGCNFDKSFESQKGDDLNDTDDEKGVEGDDVIIVERGRGGRIVMRKGIDEIEGWRRMKGEEKFNWTRRESRNNPINIDFSLPVPGRQKDS